MIVLDYDFYLEKKNGVSDVSAQNLRKISFTDSTHPVISNYYSLLEV